MFPVDVFQIEAEGLAAAHSFRVAFAQQQSVIDLLTGAHQTVGQRFVQLLHGPLNIGSGELVFRAGIAVAVQPAQLSPEDVFQKHMVAAAPLLFTVFGRDVDITHGLQKFNSRFLAGIHFQIDVFVHGSASFRLYFKKHE